MQVKLIENYINGYVKVDIEGYYIERFINTCLKEKIELWGIVRSKGQRVQAKIGSKDLEKAIEIGKNHGCIIKVKKQIGLPYVIEKYKKRKIFFLLLLIVIALIFTTLK